MRFLYVLMLLPVQPLPVLFTPRRDGQAGCAEPLDGPACG